MSDATLEELADRAYVTEVVQRSKTSFLSGMRVLPKPRRLAMYAIYAFCREVDDVADEPGPLPAKLVALAEWREEIARLFAGRPTRATTRALQRPIADYKLPEDEFLAVIDGMEMDARGPVVAPSLADLRLYCRRVAGAVGQLSIRAFGASGAEAERLAVALGEALQLTNILRDQAEDALDGRLYLPAEYLNEAGIIQREPLTVMADPRIGQVRAALGRLAFERFAESRACIARIPRRTIKPAILMQEAYWRILRRLEQRGWGMVEPRVSLPKVQKLWVALRYGLV
jgi:phytoene synthase